MNGRRPLGAAGFTLVELLAALAVLALVVGLVVPYATGGGRQTGAAASEIAAALRQARSTALREARAVSVSAPGRPDAIVFHPDGSSSGGDIAIGAVTLVVDRLTGRVRRAE
ncbi:MAG: prepilin-type N-terminal cleavage/methylation domain-containing protein [Alphaproteobacteria bacterium]|nr:prepilin-type N-terminal cleavage/methylation domain-containing protein [Alphaproteobacteria bacterium]